MLHPSLEVEHFLNQLVALIALACPLSIFDLLLVHSTNTFQIVRVVTVRQLFQNGLFNPLDPPTLAIWPFLTACDLPEPGLRNTS